MKTLQPFLTVQIIEIVRVKTGKPVPVNFLPDPTSTLEKWGVTIMLIPQSTYGKPAGTGIYRHSHNFQQYSTPAHHARATIEYLP